MDQVWVYCRAGFEPEAAAELAERAAALGVRGRALRPPGGGTAAFAAEEPGEGRRLWERLGWLDLVFARQLFGVIGTVDGLGSGDRAARVRAALAGLAGARDGFSEVWVEAPDTEAGKTLWPLCTALTEPLTGALHAANLVRRRGPRLHLSFTGPSEAVLGVSDPGRSSPWPMGIPRLRLSGEAPSRSALKLEEALLTFLPEASRPRRLAPGMYAVDLGASPGGWSWVLSRAGLRVAAVDNGPLDPVLGDLGLVEHVSADGFTWRPPHPVDWLTCDMVVPPSRVAKLVGLWAGKGLCREAIFNLKLPSGRRLQEVRRCAAIVAREAERSERPLHLRFKQLYHDREEVTGHLQLGDLPEKPPAEKPPRRTAARPAGGRGRRRDVGGPPPRRGRGRSR